MVSVNLGGRLWGTERGDNLCFIVKYANSFQICLQNLFFKIVLNLKLDELVREKTVRERSLKCYGPNNLRLAWPQGFSKTLCRC